MLFLIWSKEHRGFWKQGGYGYTHSRIDAGHFPLQKAIEICNQANMLCTDDEEPEETMVPAGELVTEEEQLEAMKMLNED